MRHILWLMPLLLGITLMMWCYHSPTSMPSHKGTREIFAIMFFMMSIIFGIFVCYDENQNRS